MCECVLECSYACVYVCTQNDVWVFMEKMSTCLDRLLKRLSGPVPEEIVCKVAVAVVKALHYLKTEHQVIHRGEGPATLGSTGLVELTLGKLYRSQWLTPALFVQM